MELFYDKSITPLKYHSFVRYFGLPLVFIRYAGAFIIRPSAYGIKLARFEMAVSLFFVVLVVVSFVGFLKWKSYGWKCNRIIIIGMIVDSILCLILSISFENNSLILVNFVLLIVYLAVGVPSLRYYKRRKPLFFPEIQPSTADEYAVSHSDPNITQSICTNYDAIPQVKFCRHCGKELAPDAIFCPKCGTKVVEVPQEAE